MARSKGEGSIYKWEEKGLWVAELTVQGKRKKKYCKTQKDARDWLLSMRNEAKSGYLTQDRNLKYGDYLDKWFEDVASPKLRPSTREAHLSLIRNHITPALGSVRVSDITPAQVQSLCAEKLKSGLSNRTVRYIKTIIHQSLETAVEWGMIFKNPAEKVTTPAPVRREVVPLTKEEVWRLLDTLSSDRLYPLYVVFLGLGLRRGEALSLFVTDVDFEKGVVTVSKTLQSLKGQGLVVGDTKSESSRRVVAMPEFVSWTLKAHLKNRGVNSPYLFATSKGTPFSPRNIVRHFKTTLRKAGLPTTTRIHDLRHFFVSWLLAQGTPPKDVQVIVGHADFGTTMQIYGHMMQGADREAAKRMDTLFKG